MADLPALDGRNTQESGQVDESSLRADGSFRRGASLQPISVIQKLLYRVDRNSDGPLLF